MLKFWTFLPINRLFLFSIQFIFIDILCFIYAGVWMIMKYQSFPLNLCFFLCFFRSVSLSDSLTSWSVHFVNLCFDSFSLDWNRNSIRRWFRYIFLSFFSLDETFFPNYSNVDKRKNQTSASMSLIKLMNGSTISSEKELNQAIIHWMIHRVYLLCQQFSALSHNK